MPCLVPYETSYVSTDKYLHINQCGILPSKDKPANVLRPNGRNDYLLLYVLDGYCILNHNSYNTKIVEKGNVILYKPNEPQYYHFPMGNNSVQIYVHFTGNGCEDLFKTAQITEQIVRPRHQNELEYYLQKLCQIFDATDNRKSLQCEGLLMTCFGLIATKSEETKEYSMQKYHRQIMQILGQIQTEPHLVYTVENWAKQCNISTQQFINIFKESTGYSPYQYLTKTRISYAKELLLFSDLSIAEISVLCGYDNQNYFARIFKKSVNLSPSEFKKKGES